MDDLIELRGLEHLPIEWIGRQVVDRDGVPLGRISTIGRDGDGSWGRVKRRGFSSRETSLSLEGALPYGDRVQLRVTAAEALSGRG